MAVYKVFSYYMLHPHFKFCQLDSLKETKQNEYKKTYFLYIGVDGHYCVTWMFIIISY